MGLGWLISEFYLRKESRTLKRSDEIILISPGFKQYLPPFMMTSKHVHIVRNWGSVETIRPGARSNPWRHRMNLDGKFIIMYTGTLALKHDPRAILALCDAFVQYEDIEIVVIAAGVNALWLAKEQAVDPRHNLRLLPLQPAAELSDVLASEDILLALLEDDAGDFAVPSKLLNYLCAGRPILLSAPSANLSVAILEESGGGLALLPGDRAGLVNSAYRLYRDEAGRRKFGESGRDYAEGQFDIDSIARRFEAISQQAMLPPLSSPLSPNLAAHT
jgi:colanic acid biosynthesis glycosyl transferase WcaI